MSLKHGLLGILNYLPRTGYDLDKSFKDSLSFFWQANTSQIYRELNIMEKEGWLESEWIIQHEKPNKRLYSITEEGRKELREWLSLSTHDIDSALSVKSSFMMRLFFSGELEVDKALVMVRAFREEAMARVEYMSHAHEAISSYGEIVNHDNRMKYWQLTAMFGDLYYPMAVEWADRAIVFLEGLKE